MPEVSIQMVIAKPRIEVWAQLRDLRVARHYVPGVSAIEYNPGPREGVGASRKVYKHGRAPIDETVIAWEDGRGFTLKIHEGDKPAAPFKWATYQYDLEDVAGGQTRLRGVFAYQMADGFVGRLLGLLVVRPALKRGNVLLESNMRKFYETGEISNFTEG